MSDLRHTIRALVREPGFTVVAVLALAVGVGSATAMFTVVDGALVRRLPYLAPERQIVILSVNGAAERVPMGAAEFLHLSKHATTLEAIGVFYPHSETVTSASGPRQARVVNLSASLFTTLGIAPARGRAFEPAEDFIGRGGVAIVSDAFWRRELDADPAAIGRTLQVAHKPVTVVGVLPAKAAFPRLEKFEIFLPLEITPEQEALPAARTGLYGIARLKPGVDATAAKAEMDALLHDFSGYSVFVQPLMSWLTAEAAPALKAAFAAVLFLLAIACANVALLLLMRGTARGRDLAIRIALGGGHRRVAFQQVMEGIVLSLAGGALGMLLAVFAVDGIVAYAPQGIPRLHEMRVDWRMGSFALLASLSAGAFAGAISAWHTLRSDLFQLLKSGAGATPSRSRVRDGLVVAQLAIALVLAAGAGLLLRSMERLSAVPVGLEPKNLLAALVDGHDGAAAEELVASARAIPGVER
ncbi:MAG: ABC transporter permease, partial [Myxococcales bacterium]|nr:ABC transporter permease [Myxococcales bacterium]